MAALIDLKRIEPAQASQKLINDLMFEITVKLITEYDEDTPAFGVKYFRFGFATALINLGFNNKKVDKACKHSYEKVMKIINDSK